METSVENFTTPTEGSCVIGNRKGLGQWRVIGRRTEGMVVKAEVGSLVASGLPQSSVSSWAAIQPHVTDDFDRDLDRYISYWEQTYRLLSALPAKPSRSDVERAAAQTLLTAGRDSRERFLNAYTRQLYDSLTAQRSHFVRVDQLVAAAADAFPGLVPSEAQLAAESNLKQGDKDGLEIDQGIFLSHVLAEPDLGIHLCHSMLLPRPETADLAAKFQASGKLDLGAARAERSGKAVLLTTANPRFLNAEDDTTIDSMELAVDVATLDRASGVAVLRGDLAHKGKYSGRPVFGAGINLTRLYHGKIPFLWFMTRELATCTSCCVASRRLTPCPMTCMGPGLKSLGLRRWIRSRSADTVRSCSAWTMSWRRPAPS